MAVDLVVLDPFSSDGWVSKQTLEAVVGTVDSGAERRLQRWTDWRREYEVPFESMDATQRIALRNFHRLRAGVVRGFLLWDVFECYAPLQTIGVGDGATKAFQLATTISDAAATLVRKIRYPVPAGTPIPWNLQGYVPGQTVATVAVTVNGAARTDFALSPTTGILTFSGAAPASGAAVVASFWHYTPVRFQDKQMSVAMRSILGTTTPALIELLNE